MTISNWDVIIIGGGAGGLSAALTLGRARQQTLVIDSGSPRNRFAEHAHGMLALDGISPSDLVATGRAQAEGYGVQLLDDSVAGVEERDRSIRVSTASGQLHEARALIVATGLTDTLPDVPGLRARWGKSVLHCPYCHGWEVRDQRLGIVALSPMALHQAQLVRQWSDDITLFSGGVVADNASNPVQLPDADAERLRARGVKILASPVTEVIGEGDAISMVKTADGALTPIDAIFTFGDAQPQDGFLASLALERADTPMGSFIAVDPLGKTSAERIWAVGNVVNPGAALPQAAGDGMFTAAQVNMSLVTEAFDRAVGEAQGQWPEIAPVDYWENRYAEKESIWSGKANAALVDVVTRLQSGAELPGTALDLGCGEGADVIWLGQAGWQATGLDISATAIERARAAASRAGLEDGSASFKQADLSDPSSFEFDQEFDLVTASFLHSTVELPRTEILRRASTLVGAGGYLLIITHASAPEWLSDHAAEHPHHHTFLTPEEEVAALDLPSASWTTVIAETRNRAATGPNGDSVTLEDGVILLQRT
ncbi:MAG: FAD-dependent oxidoreductase [Gulosibacter sp.]|uniref:FAD-dependent oxidoreductase n=1 Tax=Gulosibacter sp. TaxID=2817531 RepID=UPI003F8DCF97